MIHVYSTSTLYIKDATVTQHCTHDDGRVSWRMDGYPHEIYLIGTLAELQAFGEMVLHAAAEATNKETVTEGADA